MSIEEIILRFDQYARQIQGRSDHVSCCSVRRRAPGSSEIEALVTYYEDEARVCFGVARGVDATVAGAIGKALAEFRSATEGFVESARKRNECVVCGCAGLVSTGEGRMCKEHGMRWLEGEATVSEMLAESEEKDMG